MSAPSVPCSRTKVQNDFGCFVQEINSSPVPETIEWCHVLSSGAQHHGQGCCSRQGGWKRRIRRLRGRESCFPHVPRALVKDPRTCHLACSPRPGFPSPTAYGLVGLWTHGRQAPLFPWYPWYPAPLFPCALPGSSCSVCPVKVRFPGVSPLSSSLPMLSPAIGDATCQCH